ncbi:MAG: hypothetical protein ACRDMZ_03740, partial [Solirubrobacteraceae bacterium]
DDLRGGLGRLQGAEFVYEARLFPDLEYTFKHALTHEVAYNGVLNERRRTLHGAIVDAVERLLSEEHRARYIERLAHHALRAEVLPKALHYLRLAGSKAAARSANREAVAYPEQALELLAGQPETRERLSEELDIRMALGPPMMALKGENTLAVEALYQRMQQLVDRLDDAPRRFAVLWGICRTAYTSGRYTEARERGERLLAAAEHGTDSGQLLEAHHTLWPTLTGLGRVREVLAHAVQGAAMYDRQQHAALISYVGHDAGACCHTHLAIAHWILGYPERAAAAMAASDRLCEELEHPMTSTAMSLLNAWVDLQRGDRAACRARTQRVIALCQQHAFADWEPTAHVIECALDSEPTPLERIDELERGSQRATAWRRAFCLTVLAERYLGHRRADLAAATLGLISET